MPPFQSKAQRDFAALLELATPKGYTVTGARTKDCWRLEDAAGQLAVARDGTHAFTTAEARAYLRRLPEAG